MKNGGMNLHTNTRRHVLTMSSFTLLSFFLLLIFSVSTNSDLAYLMTLKNSSYEYSVILHNSTGTDDYITFQAWIGFSPDIEMKTGINADVVMQSPVSCYTDAVAWNADHLEANEIAVTAGIAQENKLSVGSKVYSKHVVNGSVREYTVKTILSDASSSRLTKQSNTSGIIIMGYDDLYTTNITSSIVSYTEKDINLLQQECSEVPESILYREDEIHELTVQLLPYLSAITLLSIVIASMYVWFTYKEFCHYLRRLIILGFKKKTLNHALYRYIITSGGLAILCQDILSFILWVFKLKTAWVVYVSIVSLIEFISLLIASICAKRKIWRA